MPQPGKARDPQQKMALTLKAVLDRVRRRPVDNDRPAYFNPRLPLPAPTDDPALALGQFGAGQILKKTFEENFPIEQLKEMLDK